MDHPLGVRLNMERKLWEVDARGRLTQEYMMAWADGHYGYVVFPAQWTDGQVMAWVNPIRAEMYWAITEGYA